MIQTDKNNVEYIDASGEAHCFDDAAQICMFRPLALKMPQKRIASHDKRIEALYKGKTSEFEDSVARHVSPIATDYDWGEVDEYDDGQMYETM